MPLDEVTLRIVRIETEGNLRFRYRRCGISLMIQNPRKGSVRHRVLRVSVKGDLSLGLSQSHTFFQRVANALCCF